MNHLLSPRPRGRCICGADLARGAWVWSDGSWGWQCGNPRCWDDNATGEPRYCVTGGRVWHQYAGPLIIRRAADRVTVEAG